GQAFMHMAINLDLVPRTGQTLPMISHGNSSFLAFSIVFGIILSFSRQARKDREERIRIEKEIQEEIG
ncbi:MAG: FtsW/RodA/SpoVE family cell cycle protein, partial [Bacteroidota bacterium]|nr:FtsW/RodA/SpoVE family cell cycle protein [Bacteroidota bacterium]